MTKTIARLLRGGSWLNFPDFPRASFRDGLEPDIRDANFGFRLVVRIKDE